MRTLRIWNYRSWLITLLASYVYIKPRSLDKDSPISLMGACEFKRSCVAVDITGDSPEVHFASARNKINHLNTQNYGTMWQCKSYHWKRIRNVQTIISELIPGHIEDILVYYTAVFLMLSMKSWWAITGSKSLFPCGTLSRLCKQIQIARTLWASSQTSIPASNSFRQTPQQTTGNYEKPNQHFFPRSPHKCNNGDNSSV